MNSTCRDHQVPMNVLRGSDYIVFDILSLDSLTSIQLAMENDSTDFGVNWSSVSCVVYHLIVPISKRKDDFLPGRL